MNLEDQIAVLKRALDREKRARKIAEDILEKKSLELFEANQNLLKLNTDLEEELNRRAKDLVEIAKFPNQNPNPVLRISKDGKILFSNSTATTILNDFSSRSIKPPFEKYINESLHSGKIISFITESGSEIYVFTVTPFLDEGYANLYGINDTNRINAERVLKENEEKFRRFVEYANDVIYQTDLDGHFTYLNPVALRISGFSESDLIGKSFLSLIPATYRSEALVFYQKQLEKKIENTYWEYPIVTNEKKTLWMSQNVQLVYKNNKVDGFMAFARDITERRMAEQALLRSEEKYRGIIENLEMGLLEVDNDCIIQKAYPGFLKLTGYSEEELIGQNAVDLFPDKEGKEMMLAQSVKRKKGEAGVFEVKIKRKDGSFIWVIISGTPYYDHEDNVIGSIGIHWDITNRKKIETDLIHAKEVAEESLKIKQDFLANMSHEIRTPMNAIVGMSNLLSSTKLDTQQKEYLNAISISSENLLVIINDILDFSKMESGKIEMESIPFDFYKCLTNVHRLLLYKAEEKGLQFELEIDSEINRYLIGDPTRISQIFTNLIANAIKFTSSGFVKIKVVKVMNSLETQTLKIEVSDSGIGIEKDKIGKIFDSFSQANDSITRNFGGSGLGLAIAKNIIELMGGSIEVHSVLDKGSTFTTILPFEVAPELPYENHVHAPDDGALYQLDGIKVLLAEDNEFNQLVAISNLEKWGIKCDVAFNGQECIEKCSDVDYDLILMDIRMPIMDGIKATSIIRNELKSNVPIIALTANAFKEEKLRCLKIGMNDYLSKPFEVGQLNRMIIKNLNLSNQPKLIENTNISSNTISNMNDAQKLYKLDKLKETTGDDVAFTNQMIDLFIEKTLEDISSMKTCLKDNDLVRVGNLAHKIKPSLDIVSISQLSTDVRIIESLEKGAEIAEEQINEFISNVYSLIDQLKEYRKNSQ